MGRSGHLIRSPSDAWGPAGDGGALRRSETAAVFVYGTLRTRGGRHALLRRLGGRRVARAAVTGHLIRIGAYVALVPGPRRRIAGELYRLPVRAFRVLDRYEDALGSRPRYCRRHLCVDRFGGPAERAWVYCAAVPPGVVRGPQARPLRTAPAR